MDQAARPGDYLRTDVQVGGDFHVYVDGLPVYVLENRRAVPEADPEWLRELPSSYAQRSVRDRAEPSSA
ncbi:hypothetical protein [Streptomyces sp. SudanB135_2055]|uniref:hypothetical protein n=1 Tax=Streptomyces sp. SudanB135_2055 TaxID=3035279 RepID=UPI0036D86637